MHLRTVVLFSLMLSLLMFNACSKEASAKRKLKKMDIEYTATSFLGQIKQGNISAIDLFLTAGIDPNTKDSNNRTALSLAAEGGHIAIVQALLTTKKVYINEKDNMGWSALMYATGNGHNEIAQALITGGADIHIKDNAGNNALMVSAKGGYTNIAKILIDKGADVKDKNNDGFSASMIAAINGNIDLVKLLKNAGATEPIEDTIFADLLGKQRDDPLILRFKETLKGLQTVNELFTDEASEDDGITLNYHDNRLNVIYLHSKNDRPRSRIIRYYNSYAKPLPYGFSFKDSQESIHNKIGEPTRIEFAKAEHYDHIYYTYILPRYTMTIQFDRARASNDAIQKIEIMDTSVIGQK